MKILFPVAQAECLRKGIDAPTSTVTIEIDPATLTERERATLASKLRDGHKYTGESIVGGDLGAVRVELARIHAEEDALSAKLAERIAAGNAELRASLERPLEIREEEIGMTLDGMVGSYGPIKRTITYPVCPQVPQRWNESGSYRHTMADSEIEPELLERLRVIRVDCEARRAAAMESVLPEMRAEAERIRTEKREAERRETVQREALYARIPAELRARDEAGYAEVDEVKRAMISLVRSDVYPDYQRLARTNRSKNPVGVLTDAQFARLLEIRAGAPEGASVEAYRLYDVGYRPAEDDEVGDEDDEVKIEENEIIAARVVWNHAGLEIVAQFPLE